MGNLKVEVEMLAYGGGKVRTVEIPMEAADHAVTVAATPEQAKEAMLELAFKYGQNDFQPKPFPSVSVGDVVRMFGTRFKVSAVGFEEL